MELKRKTFKSNILEHIKVETIESTLMYPPPSLRIRTTDTQLVTQVCSLCECVLGCTEIGGRGRAQSLKECHNL